MTAGHLKLKLKDHKLSYGAERKNRSNTNDTDMYRIEQIERK